MQMHKIFAPNGPRINPRTGWTLAKFVCVGDVEPKTLLQVWQTTQRLMVHFPLGFFSPPGCNTRVGGCGGSTKLMPQIKINLIILNFTSTRAFSSYNTKRAVHGRMHYTFTHSMVENAANMTNMTSNGTQNPVPWIKMLDIVHLTFLQLSGKEEQINEAQ